jgi:hypothetical protein
MHRAGAGQHGSNINAKIGQVDDQFPLGLGILRETHAVVDAPALQY